VVLPLGHVLQYDLPVDDEYFPFAQLGQLDAPELEYLPREQLSQDDQLELPDPWNFPAAHVEQDDLPVRPVYLPPGQYLQLSSPWAVASWYLPAVHERHARVEPKDTYLPAPQHPYRGELL
jgi:hypothetical protein